MHPHVADAQVLPVGQFECVTGARAAEVEHGDGAGAVDAELPAAISAVSSPIPTPSRWGTRPRGAYEGPTDLARERGAEEAIVAPGDYTTSTRLRALPVVGQCG